MREGINMGVLDYLAWFPKKYPRRYGALRFILIHLHTLFIIFVLAPYIAFDMKINGYTKYGSFFTELYLLFTEDWIIIIVLFLLVFVSMIIFYFLVWRFIFNDYIRVYQDIPGNPAVRSPEGRVYWTVNHGLGAWAKQKRGEKLGDIIIWYNGRSFFNIFFPLRSLQQMHGIDQGAIESDGPFSLLIHEKGRTTRQGSSDLIYKIGVGPLKMYKTDLKSAEEELQLSINQLIRDSVNVSKADAKEIKEKYRFTSAIIPNELYLQVEDKLREMGFKEGEDGQ